MAKPTFSGSSLSILPLGLPVFTEQKRQPRVHTSPINMNVAVPPLQHSDMLGQRASWQTVAKFSDFNNSLISKYFSPAGARTLIHSGFGVFCVVGCMMIILAFVLRSVI